MYSKRCFKSYWNRDDTCLCTFTFRWHGSSLPGSVRRSPWTFCWISCRWNTYWHLLRERYNGLKLITILTLDLSDDCITSNDCPSCGLHRYYLCGAALTINISTMFDKTKLNPLIRKPYLSITTSNDCNEKKRHFIKTYSACIAYLV